ncbi:TetR family transcriptional regulator [Kineothrix alysoides]|uniref:TetR family transcriptional regulator n=1 Tax=Kineothrix alysoides TaxID=1469948 RepID=A0A4R1R170_9FIRM|nr:TetR/AcrR family transcriptional regulator [Kineothrix alysoides]TCL59060.1 TetR family transcriptional regulator [Kineothrix alysoides]
MGKKGEETKQHIRKVAYGLFAEKGFKAVTMKDICEKAELSRGGLYRHYPGTEEIFEEIINEFMQKQEDEFADRIENGVPATRILEEVLSRYKSEMKDSGTSLSVAIYEYYTAEKRENNALLMRYGASKRMWQRLIAYGMERGEFRRVDAEAVYDVIVFSYQGVRMYSKMMPIDENIPERIVKQIKEMLL